MTHLGQRLSALIDGELEGSERERVLLHMAKCGACRDEVAALRMLKRRMTALGDTAAGAALNGLTGRLMDLSRAEWPPGSAGHWPDDGPWPAAGQDRPEPRPADQRPDRPDQRAGRYFLAGTLAVFLAGLGTAAFVAGGEPQPQAPTPPVTPSVDLYVVQHGPASVQVAHRSPVPSAARFPAQLTPAPSLP